MKKSIGFSLIEIMASVAVIGIISSTAVPMFTDYIENSRLHSAAEGVYGNVQLTRSEAIKSNKNMHFSVTDGAAWCYGFDQVAGCNCTASSNNCSVNTTSVKGVTLSFDGATAVANGIYFSPNGAVFKAADNSSINGKVIFEGSNSKSVSVLISRLGHISICSSTIPGYSACP